jgi:hypothetical protein
MIYMWSPHAAVSYRIVHGGRYTAQSEGRYEDALKAAQTGQVLLTAFQI